MRRPPYKSEGNFIEPKGNSIYVSALRAQMEKGLSLEQAYKSFLNEAKAGPGEGSEHLSEIRQSYEYLKSLDAKS